MYRSNFTARVIWSRLFHARRARVIAIGGLSQVFAALLSVVRGVRAAVADSRRSSRFLSTTS
jgi:hypothetical protein